MKEFMDEKFLLTNETGVELFERYAKKMPIFDFHCHLNPKEIWEDKKYRNITEIWLGGDHYKWRAMRTNGVDEKYITGDASDHEKFMKWAETMPYTIGNPLYHWTHMELQRYFGIKETLSPKTAEDIWNKCNEQIEKDEFSARNLIRRMNVKIICTTDDPKDSLEYHKKLKEEGFEVKILPTFRPDNSVHIEKPAFIPYIEEFSKTIGYSLENYEDLEKALKERVKYFDEMGSCVSDHGLDSMLYAPSTIEEVKEIYKKALAGEKLSIEEIKKYKGRLLTTLGKEYNKYGWAMQLHIGPMRNNSTRMLKKIGADTGFDSVNDKECAEDLSRFLDALDITEELPKTVIYCLNPKDNEVLATMCGNFQDGKYPGKIQFGSGWWFNDQKNGMERQMEALCQMGLISRFVGMLTDSRSFLSFPRHEYFRRILCNKIGMLVEDGEYPNDMEFLGEIIEGICYNNAIEYFKK